MAKIGNATKDGVVPIEKFLGINECPDGDTNLKIGEASAMTNFCITENNSLQVRKGSKSVSGLLSTYAISVASETTTISVELNASTNSYIAYPTISISSGGILTLSGTPVTVNYANIASYAGYYTTINGLIYQLGTCTYAQPTTGTHVTGGSVVVGNENAPAFWPDGGIVYRNVAVSDGAVNVSGAYENVDVNSDFENNNYYGYGSVLGGEHTNVHTWKIASFVQERHWFLVNSVTSTGDDTYTWKFKLVSATSESTDISVRGIWSGYVNGVEYIVSAANGKLWSLTESNGVWTKTEIGAVTTTNGNIHMFGFDKNLYILDGTQYHVWNGTALSAVTGYRPLIQLARTPTGDTYTEIEGINKLNGLRRVRFSPDGTATTFKLPETGLTSVDYAIKTADNTAVSFVADKTTGIVTISPALVAGTNTIEIGYTFPTSYRSQVVAMKFSENYNGATDTRIFLYGDGSNTAFYSGLDYNGKPTAEYFPDLNVMSVDSANTPITSMAKHFDRLITYKPDGAFITNYGNITLSSGSTVSAFYTTPLNREIGNIAVGQVKIVNNNPLTLFGRSVYEWQLSSYASKDERNAVPISDRVAQTLSTLDLKSAICFDDVFHSEYYVCQNEKAVVYNYAINAWYTYDNLPITCMITYKQEVYFGDTNGYIRHFSRDYLNDNGEKISAYWESGSMDFGAGFKRKYSPCLWLGIKPEAYGEIVVTVKTDRQNDLSEETSASDYSDTSASGFFSFLDLDFTRLSFNVNSNPQTDKLKIKAKKFTYYKLIFSSVSNNTTSTITNAYIQVRYTGNVR